MPKSNVCCDYMTNLFVLLFFVTIIGCKQTNHKIIDKYPDGQTKTEYIYDNDDTTKFTCIIYHENGNPLYKTQVVNNMFVGEKIIYNENGIIERIEKLIRPISVYDSTYDCLITTYRPNGTKISEYKYLNDEIDGIAIDYDSLGRPAISTEYREGRIDGKKATFYAGGGIKNLIFIKNDTIRGLDIDFKENGDTLKWFSNSGKGQFYKKWLNNGNILTGTYGDAPGTYVIWDWFDKTNSKIKTKIDKSPIGKYIAPE